MSELLPTVPDGYPHSLTEDELREALTTLVDEFRAANFSENSSFQYGPLLTVGQVELEARITTSATDALGNAIDTFRRSSENASRTLNRLTGVLVVLTFVVAGATIALVLH